MRFPSRPILYASGFNAESRQAAIVAYWYRKKSPDSVRNAASEEDSFISAKWGLFAISQASCFRAASRDTKSNGSNRFFGRARRRSAIVESFGRRQASESLRCPNRGSHGLSYGESCFALMVGKPGAAQKRTCAIADRRDMGRKSGRGKADGPVLIERRLLLGSIGASASASRCGSALDRVCARPCRVTAQVSRMRVRTVAVREADSGARRPR